MGLSICKSIIESHKGKIWVSAGASRGSIFQFELPTPALIISLTCTRPMSEMGSAGGLSWFHWTREF